MDWRKQIERNKNKTFVVMSCFVLIYTFIGFMIDMYLNISSMSKEYGDSIRSIRLSEIFAYSIQNKIPKATLILFAIAIISIIVSYRLYDRIMLMGLNYRPASPDSDKKIINIVEELRIASGMRYTPQIFIIEEDYMNAFASGYSEKSAMICVTEKLVEILNRSELQAVIAHELTHIRNLDIKLTLAVSILSNIMIIVLDLMLQFTYFSSISESRESRYSRDDDDNGGGINAMAFLGMFIAILRIVLPIITMLLWFFLSRTREYMADAGAVELTRDNGALANALIKIHNSYESNENTKVESDNVRRSAYMIDPSSSFMSLMSTHPSLEKRLKALRIS